MGRIRKIPLGIEPRWVWETKRMVELKGAILRYLDENLVVPAYWLEEYNDLVNSLNKENDDSEGVVF